MTTTTNSICNSNPNPNQTMLDEQTYQKMMNMKLTAMAASFKELLREAPGNQLSFAERSVK